MAWKQVDTIDQTIKPHSKLLINGLKFIRLDELIAQEDSGVLEEYEGRRKKETRTSSYFNNDTVPKQSLAKAGLKREAVPP